MRYIVSIAFNQWFVGGSFVGFRLWPAGMDKVAGAALRYLRSPAAGLMADVRPTTASAEDVKRLGRLTF